MKRIFFASLSILSFLFLPSAHSQTAPVSDSSKIYNLSEVVISATRTPINAKDAPSRVTRIDVEKMRNAGFDDAQSMLSFVNGVFLNIHGPGQIGTVLLRGTSSEQTLFLLDGVSLNNIQNGDVDLFLTSATNLSSIEISQGGASALYGANAVGGVVNLESKASPNNFMRVDLGGGSYGNQMMGGEISEGIGSARVDLIVQRWRGVNDFDFTFSDGTKGFPMKFTGADYVKDVQSLKITLPSLSSSTSFLIQNISADRGTPGAVFDPSFVGTARETDKNTMAVLKNTGNIGVFDYSASAGFIYSYLKYADPSYAINDYYKTSSLQPSVQLSYLKKEFSSTAGIDAEFDRGQSNNMTGIKNRNRAGMFASGGYDFRKNSDLETRLFGALRYDGYSDFGSSFNPKAGINIKPLVAFPIHLRANVGTSYRVPTFNELYYAGLGNANLKPERATDYDLGAVAEFNSSQIPYGIDVDLDYYSINTRDGIVWRPVDQTGSIWLPENFQKIISRGFELSLNLKYATLFHLKGNYSFGKSLDASDPANPSTYNKQLIYLPQHQSSLIAKVTPWIFTFSAAIQYVGERFYFADNSALLSPYAVTFVSASAKVDAGSFELLPKVSIDDLFNRRYEVIYEYPMPGRTYRLGLSVQFDQDK